MCIICVSKSGVRQPTERELYHMFLNNPHGAGYMVARRGLVSISKGYMDFDEFLNALGKEHFTERDSVVYHFRISTQAGVGPEMTHPFPLSNRLGRMEKLETTCRIGVAHNRNITLTTDPNNHRYSDTAFFITQYLSHLVKRREDLRNRQILDAVWRLAQSKFAIMDGSGYVATVGTFLNRDGLLFSNASFQGWRAR